MADLLFDDGHRLLRIRKDGRLDPESFSSRCPLLPACDKLRALRLATLDVFQNFVELSL